MSEGDRTPSGLSSEGGQGSPAKAQTPAKRRGDADRPGERPAERSRTRRLEAMADRDPYVVLGVARGASQTQIKAAWRRLARENHPDLTGSDPGTLRAATRRMAQINAAYERLRDGPDAKRRRAGEARAAERADAEPADLGGRKRPSGPPPPKPTRPVTGRLDTSGTFRVRNRTTTPRGTGGHRSAEPPPTRPAAEDREPPRASDPTGPLRRARIHKFRRAPLPELAAAQARRDGVRQVPRPHARRDRRLRALLHRLDLVDDQPRRRISWRPRGRSPRTWIGGASSGGAGRRTARSATASAGAASGSGSSRTGPAASAATGPRAGMGARKRPGRRDRPPISREAIR